MLLKMLRKSAFITFLTVLPFLLIFRFSNMFNNSVIAGNPAKRLTNPTKNILNSSY